MNTSGIALRHYISQSNLNQLDTNASTSCSSLATDSTSAITNAFSPLPSDNSALISSEDVIDQSNFFWRYNTQSKGPKTSRCSKPARLEQYSLLHEYNQKYGSQSTSIDRPSYKIRKGEGADVTPNRQRLLNLGRAIGSLTLKSKSLRNNDFCELKKEKNKIASRCCRLKKKAEQEAYKIKLDILNREYETLTVVLQKIHNAIANYKADKRGFLTSYYDNLLHAYYGDQERVAGNLDNYVCLTLKNLIENG